MTTHVVPPTGQPGEVIRDARRPAGRVWEVFYPAGGRVARGEPCEFPLAGSRGEDHGKCPPRPKKSCVPPARADTLPGTPENHFRYPCQRRRVTCELLPGRPAIAGRSDPCRKSETYWRGRG